MFTSTFKTLLQTFILATRKPFRKILQLRGFNQVMTSEIALIRCLGCITFQHFLIITCFKIQQHRIKAVLVGKLVQRSLQTPNVNSSNQINDMCRIFLQIKLSWSQNKGNRGHESGIIFMRKETSWKIKLFFGWIVKWGFLEIPADFFSFRTTKPLREFHQKRREI